ncbi:hypothetical protein [Deinococcus pimensis]|uniref:hypothetical protein n=1 Tax=Deinococcus pimensis TaxID=309888 RepID=UPI0004834A8F|nr:hypothetical protein [Deinococcus pimensis]
MTDNARSPRTSRAAWTRPGFAMSALLTLSAALAQTSGGKNDPTDIVRNGICGTNGGGLLGFVTNPLFVGVALAAGIAIWGWNQYFGQMDSTVALKRGFIGMIAVLCCATIAGFFIKGC